MNKTFTQHVDGATPCSPTNASARSRRSGNTSDRHSSKEVNGICQACNQKFKRTRPWQKFCSSKCRWDEWAGKNPRIRELDEYRKKYEQLEGEVWPS